MSALGLQFSAARGIVSLGAGLRTALVARRLRDPRAGLGAQERTFRHLMRSLATTQFGAAVGISPEMPYETFRASVGVRDYERFVPWIERMKAGEGDVLWPGRCDYFAVSSGTTAGRTKYLPITAGMLTHFRRAGLDSLFYYAVRAGHSRVFDGRHLFLGGSTALTMLPRERGPAAWAGDLSGITAMNLPGWAEHHLYEPGRTIAQMSDWPEKLRAIARRTAGRDVTMLAGIPSWLLIFAETMRSHTQLAPLKKIWPRLECLVHGGVPVTPFAEELRAAVGPGVTLHEVYPASEAFIAAQDSAPESGLRLLADAGVFYEFVPLNLFDSTWLGGVGDHAVPLAGVQPGVDYVLLLTTPGGLCRYVIGDIVRFVSTQPPRLVYVGRTRLQLSAFGEHVIERELTETLAEVAAAHGCTVANFHVAPRFSSGPIDARRGRHEWWIELRPPGIRQSDAAAFAVGLDHGLQRRNDDYEAKRRGGGLDTPTVHLAPPGTFETWMRRHGKWGGQSKMPRCRSDREVADELADLSESLCDIPRQFSEKAK